MERFIFKCRPPDASFQAFEPIVYYEDAVQSDHVLVLQPVYYIQAEAFLSFSA